METVGRAVAQVKGRLAVLHPAEAATTDPKSRPLVEAVARTEATAIVLDRAAQADDSIVAQAAALHEAGVRVRTLSLCYDEWLGKLPLSELERISLMFDIGEVHRARYGPADADPPREIVLIEAFQRDAPVVGGEHQQISRQIGRFCDQQDAPHRQTWGQSSAWTPIVFASRPALTAGML